MSDDDIAVCLKRDEIESLVWLIKYAIKSNIVEEHGCFAEILFHLENILLPSEEAKKRVIDKILATPESSHRFLVEAGIVESTGGLTEPYRDEE